jgi:hypothetical protein
MLSKTYGPSVAARTCNARHWGFTQGFGEPLAASVDRREPIMKLKSLLLASALCFGGSAFLGAKTRTFTIDKPVLIGNYSVPPGSYQMRVKGETVEITDLNHFADKKPVKVNATTTMGDQRSRNTIVQTVNDNGTDRVTQIDLSHSRRVVEFQ